jgi:ribonuclease HI
MNLVVHVATACHNATGRSACGIVVTDAETSRTIHELLRELASPVSSRGAEYEAMLKAVEVIAPLNPEEIEFRTGTPWLIDQLTGIEPSDDPLFEQLQMALLRLDLWRIRGAEGLGLRYAEELAKGER